MFSLTPKSSTPLVTQIVDGFRRLIDENKLRPGSKLPSIRQLASAHQVSIYTVADAYDRLVAQGYFVSQPQSGFFVRRQPSHQGAEPAPKAAEPSFGSDWYLRQMFENRLLKIKPGCGWLPGEWLFQDGLRRSLRNLAHDEVDLGGYGEPKGYPPLRQWVRDALAEHQVAVATEQILLTAGSSLAMNLVARLLVRDGDPVLVDDPGYANQLVSLRHQNARLLGVARTPTGYDFEQLEHHLQQERPKVFFTQPRLQSPTGSTAQLSQLHRLVQLAEKYDLTLVENDIYADLDPEPRPSLASLDQLRRVIYLSSFSKTISPNLRVGYVTARPDVIEGLTRLKLLSGLTSSEFSERLVHGALIDGRSRRHNKSLRNRLALAHEGVSGRLADLGFEIFCEPGAGLFMWVRHPAAPDAGVLAKTAAQQSILLGPGHLFQVDQQPSPWLRFNVAYCGDEAIFAFLEAALREGTGTATEDATDGAAS
ncbi:PLP-dependent aminotransferase family protein [Ramlibacter sp. AN1015]|uniref:aminotransferase-like domain-containing protein n=1 Tax=Ramlibacter sp. AN1015 TaxID=3133428 RepID=UPI0030BB0076